MSLETQKKLIDKTCTERTREFDLAVAQLARLLGKLAPEFAHDRSVVMMLAQLHKLNTSS